MTSHAKDARTGLADLLDWVGPDAPTLCEGWDARDLAAHLAIRDRRPDALPGIGISAFAKHTQKVQDEMAARPYPEVVDLVRFGPPVYNLARLKAVDERVNLVEYFVHTEDVLRAQPDWHEPRTLDHDVEDALFSALSMMGRLAFRSSPVGVVAVCPGHGRAVLKKTGDDGAVVLTGAPGEILLLASGRTDQVRVEVSGEPAAVAAFESQQRSL